MTAPAPYDVLHIPLGGSQDDKTARLSRGPGVLRAVYDCDQGHVGEQRKRRGFTRIPLDEEILGVSPEAVFLSLAVWEGTLVLVGVRDVYGVAANDDVVDGAALVRRGPSMAGSYRTGIVHVSPIGTEA